MARPLTVLVLTPRLGGDYFGEVLAGLASEVVGARGRLVVIETLPATAPRDGAGEPSDFAARIAWPQADGVISITAAVGAGYLQRSCWDAPCGQRVLTRPADGPGVA